MNLALKSYVFQRHGEKSVDMGIKDMKWAVRFIELHESTVLLVLAVFLLVRAGENPIKSSLVTHLSNTFHVKCYPLDAPEGLPSTMLYCLDDSR